MSRRIKPGLVALAALLACALAPAGAHAFWGNGAEMVSADYERLEQGDDATTFAAISGDARYVAIQTRARNFFADDDPDPPGQYRAGGVFRFDRASRELDKVADGDLFDEATNDFLRRGASNPSISADGRYVAFATAEPLVSTDVNDYVDVYVRDMEVPIGQPGDFDLVSALDGADVPIGYGAPPFPFPGSNPGVDVSRGVALSADGQHVVFRTDSPSDVPAGGSPTVAAGQILLRDRAANETRLITRTDPGGSPAGGALGAAVSADGSTVAWTGSNAAAQTRFLNGENTEPSFLYYLWQRVADGPAAPTRRITGISDPDDPGCDSGTATIFDQSSTGPCYGPLTDQEANRTSISGQLPSLSANGQRVAFLTGAGPRPLAFTGPGLDLYVAEMAPGLTRKAATLEVTRDPANPATDTSSPIAGLAISGNGRYVAISTSRTRFETTPFSLSAEARPVAGVRELYVVDLEARRIDRVARSYAGGDIDADVQNGITLSADGQTIAYTSFAGNLLFGDANQRADAFVSTRVPDDGNEPLPPPDDGPSVITPDPEAPRVTARAKAKGGGRVVVTVTVPAAGAVKAVATALAGEPRKRRTLASERARAAKPGQLEIAMRPVARYRDELRDRGRIKGHVQVGFVASAGGRRLNDTAPIVFKQSKR